MATSTSVSDFPLVFQCFSSLFIIIHHVSSFLTNCSRFISRFFTVFHHLSPMFFTMSSQCFTICCTIFAPFFTMCSQCFTILAPFFTMFAPFFTTFQDAVGFDITICDGEVFCSVPDSWRRLGNERIDPRPTLQATSRVAQIYVVICSSTVYIGGFYIVMGVSKMVLLAETTVWLFSKPQI